MVTNAHTAQAYRQSEQFTIKMSPERLHMHLKTNQTTKGNNIYFFS